MSDIFPKKFIYNELEPLYPFNNTTELNIQPSTLKLYIVKTIPVECVDYYEIIAKTDEPSLAKIICVTAAKDGLKAVREYISGDTLSDLLADKKTLTEEQAISITTDVCRGLSALHKNGLVHRDINPNNIIISSDGKAKIIDYGIIRSFTEKKSSDTVVLGTPGFAAPEQFGFSQSDKRTDIYAVGVLLNVMVTGKLPKDRLAGGLIGDIVKKCTHIDSAQRYQDVGKIIRTLNHREMRGKTFPERIFLSLPGIRSGKPVRTGLAMIVYLTELIIAVTFYLNIPPVWSGYVKVTISLILWFVVPLFCIHNYLGIWDRLPGFRNLSRISQAIFFSFLGVVSFIVGLVVFSVR